MRRSRGRGVGAAALALGMFAACAASGTARAEPDEDDQDPSILDSVAAFRDIAAARDALADRGFRFSGFYFSDVRGNLTGGMRRGVTYSGLLKLALDVDAEKVAGIEGGRLHVDMLQIHGRDLSDDYIGNVLSVNDVGARPTTRLFELWYEQKFGDRFALKVGQLAADEEFIKSEYGEAFLDATFGWAGPPSENLPFGGPAYPLAALGAQA
ncbi:carbohydrate porin, partial [Hansschlegelia beijingensis]